MFGEPGPSSFGKQTRINEIIIEQLVVYCQKFRWVYARNVAPSSGRWTLKAGGSRCREAWGSWGQGVPLPSRLGIWGSVVSSPSGPPTHSRHISGLQNPSRNNALRNQSKMGLGKIWGAVPPGLSLKPPLGPTSVVAWTQSTSSDF